MRTVTMRCITAAALSVYLLLTVGVGVRVCGCCGSMNLSILWKMMDACGTCCQTDVYVMDAAFCPMTEDFSEADFSVEPFERFTVLATFRYSDSKVWLKDRGLVERPLVSRYKGVLNLQYATRMNIWTFDFTAQINGPARLPDFAVKPGESGMSPVYPVLFAQITRKFKGVDLYVGVENITNCRQKHPVISAEDPWSPDFNASVIWGPLTGVTAYAGVRFTLWK